MAIESRNVKTHIIEWFQVSIICSFEEAIDLAAEGDSTEIDMLVGDIYGKECKLCDVQSRNLRFM